jgi:hypothetical protein
MAETNELNRPGKAALWTGRILSIIPVLMLLMSAAFKFAKPEFVMKEFTRLGYGENLTLGLGILELFCTILYAIPATSVLGAILLTGYLGGATTTHLRIGDSFIPPIILGIVIWLGLFLREPRLRWLIPLRR